MRKLSRITAALCLAAASVVATAPSATAADPDYLVVDTQFSPGPAAVVDAGGAFEGCWKVRALWGTGIELPDGQVWFEGEKRVQCAAGSKVTVHYVAQLVDGGTSGTWWITESTLDGATSGGGTVVGDSTTCEPVKKAAGCILDTFSGDVG